MGVTKYVLPVIVAAMAGMILITLGESSMSMIYPMPAGIDKYDADSLGKYIGSLPKSAFILLLINYAVCSFLAGVIATLIAKRVAVKPAIVVGIVLTFAGLYNVINLPHPLWFSIVNLLEYLPMAYLGYLVSRKKIMPESVNR